MKGASDLEIYEFFKKSLFLWKSQPENKKTGDRLFHNKVLYFSLKALFGL